MSDKFYVGLDVTDFADKGIFRPVSRVTLLVDDSVALTAGDDTGMEISASCPHATQEMVDSLLAQFKGYQYHAYTAGKANIDPAAELGDGVTAGGVYSVLSRIKEDGNGYADLSAPGEAAIEDEYPDAGPMTREFTRKIAETRSLITKTASEIRLEVMREIDGLSSSVDIQLGGITATVQGLDGKVTTLEQTDSEIKATVKGQGEALSTITQTVSGIETTVRGQGNEISTIKQTVTGIQTTVKGQGDELSTIKQTVTGIQTTVKGQGEDISTVTQTADKVNWLIKSGTSESNFTLTDRTINLVSEKINLTGYVTFSALTESGKTEINGANITTGTISAERIDVDELKIKKIYGQDGKQAIYSTDNSLYVGTDGSYGDYNSTYICAKSQVILGDSGNYKSIALIIDTKNYVIRPSNTINWDLGTLTQQFGDLYIENITFHYGTDSSYAKIGHDGNNKGFSFVCSGDTTLSSLGSSTYYWSNAYIKKLFLSNSCIITAGDGSSIKVASSTTASGVEISASDLNSGFNTVKLDSTTFRPSNSSSYSLGSSSYYWIDGYIKKLHLSATSVISELSGNIRFTSSLIPETSNVKDLGSSSYYWDTLYVGSIFLKYGTSYTSIELTCNSSKKLCVDGTAIH